MLRKAKSKGCHAAGQYGIARSLPVGDYFTADHLGSTSLVTDASGNEVARQKYYPFGAPRSTSGTLPTDYRFTGQRSEEAALGSLYHYRARFYSPVLGRFLQPDPLVPEPGNPQSLNQYAYVLNNPLRYTDPTGHDVACPGYDAGACRHGSPRSRNYRTQYGDDTFELDDIPHYTGQNPFDTTGKISKAAYQAALDYGVPPQIVATILQLENNPNAPLAGVRRAIKQAVTPLLQTLDSDHDQGKGWSLGPGNVKPGTAASVKWHFAVYYPEKDLAQQSGIGKQDFVSKLTDPETNARFVAGYVREAIDAVYEPGYEGPMSTTGLALVINYYNTGTPDIDALKYGYGRAGVHLLRAAAEGTTPLIFYVQP